MANIDPSFMTFYFKDGTKETVKAYTFQMGLNKLNKDGSLMLYDFWEMGEGSPGMVWDEVTKKWSKRE